MHRRFLPLFFVMTVAYIAELSAFAEYGVLIVRVRDAQDHAVSPLEIGLKSGGGSDLTDADGYARIGLFKGTNVNDWVEFKILHSPPGKRYVINSPWYLQDRIPPFENENVNFVNIVVVPFGDRSALERHVVQVAMAARVNRTKTLKMWERDATAEDRHANLEAVAKQYGLTPAEVNRAIRALAKKPATPFEAGLSAFYERDYEEAEKAFRVSLQQSKRTRRLNEKEHAYAAFFLGESLYAQGKYSDAVQAYQKSLQLFENDPLLLNNIALGLNYAGDPAGAEKLLRKVLETQEKAAPQDEAASVPTLNNLASTLVEQSDFSEAEPLYERALAIEVNAVGWNKPEVATILNNRGWLSKAEKNYEAAERDYQRALAIRLMTLPADHPDVATSLNNLGVLLQDRNDYSGAQPLLREALAIRAKALPPDHPLLADSCNNLGSLLQARGNFGEAEPLHRRALEIREKRLGPFHPMVAQSLNNLGTLLADTGDYAGAQALLERALAIRDKVLGPNHALTKLTRENLKQVRQKVEDSQPK